MKYANHLPALDEDAVFSFMNSGGPIASNPKTQLPDIPKFNLLGRNLAGEGEGFAVRLFAHRLLAENLAQDKFPSAPHIQIHGQRPVALAVVDQVQKITISVFVQAYLDGRVGIDAVLGGAEGARNLCPIDEAEQELVVVLIGRLSG